MNRINGTALPKNRHWTAEEERLLGTKSDCVLARKFDRTVTAVTARRHRKHIRFLKKWNRTLSGVSRRRVRLKIPPWRPRSTNNPK
jgi:hypothetical protein